MVQGILPLAWRRALAALLLVLTAWAAPAHAQVTITFWSQDTGENFPHAFFTLSGRPVAGGPAVDASYGFTLKTVSPAVLFGDVPGRIDETKKSYIMKSNAHFSKVLTDAQYAAVMRLVDEWGEKGNSTYSLNSRNCVHFSAEAMRRSGLVVEEPKKLMKKPRSFTLSILKLNPSVTVWNMPAAQYYAAAGVGARPGQTALAK